MTAIWKVGRLVNPEVTEELCIHNVGLTPGLWCGACNTDPTHPDYVLLFNQKNPIDTPVRYWPGLREGDGIESETRTRAWLLGGHTPVVMVKGHAGGVALTHVEVLT